MSSFEDTQRLAQTMARESRDREGLRPKTQDKSKPVFLRARFIFLAIILSTLPTAVLVRAAYIQMVTADFLRDQGDSRSMRLTQLLEPRATITDRHGEELAVSIPSESLWVDPVEVLSAQETYPTLFTSEGWKQLSHMIDMEPNVLTDWVTTRGKRRFSYLKRHLSQNQAEVIRALKLPGMHLMAEARRFYPTGEVSAHITGFTNVDGKGLEGVERSYDKWLSGEPGKVLVRKDLLGNVIESAQILKTPKSGNDLTLSIDNRIQTISYMELKKAYQQNHADSASVVVLDIETGEILSMVNQPSFNPNYRETLDVQALRNRAVTDVFEPGSTLKPFTALAALQSGKFTPESMIDTRAMKVNGYWVGRAHHDGVLSVADIIKKSSNVGVTKMALSLPEDEFLDMFAELGFGSDTGSGFPGESMGVFRERKHWSDIEKATLSFGYGISVTALQLAKAYAVLGSGGILRPVTFIKQEKKAPGKRIFSEKLTREVLAMMEKVVQEGGTGTKANLESYQVAGKTGTAIKAKSGGYGDDYIAVFAGVAPMSKPRLAIVVMVNNPKGDTYYGGELAAPVFAAIMERSLRWLDVPPDKKVTPLMLVQNKPVEKKISKILAGVAQ
ncbi:MAG: peptidoglycan glycosyltransferase FtsI [Gammaproteobacteria bacterium CG22_combo_CG10-13_8_21_14_all_40_8]|nr:MAG: peptidoglycan glycosyltransferase FtsI [Gammaproteobacteria bacterium CG22_combo_CG10-13_8_21_14_all_40_8]